jgi:hypothetical protein
MLWRNIQINSKWVQSLYGTKAGTTPLALGRVVQYDFRDNKVKLALNDGIEEVGNAQFIWDYDPLHATDSGAGTDFYGTVYNVVGSTIIIEESPDHDLRKTMNTIQNKDVNRRSFTETWQRLGNLGVIGTDSLVNGDIIKFHKSALAPTDAGSVLLTVPQYTVQSGSFFVNDPAGAGNTGEKAGTFGTIEFQTAPQGVEKGMYLYKRKPLWYRGNPGQIVYDLLTGSNTNLRWNGSTINGTYFGAATKAVAQYDFEALIVNEGQGAVLDAIKQISEPLDAVFFFDRVGSFCWIPDRPRMRDDADFVSDRYYGTVTGGTEGTNGNMWSAAWNQEIKDVLTDIVVNHDFNHFEDDSGRRFRGQVRRQNLNTATVFRGYRNTATLDSQWLRHYDDAVIVAERKLRKGSVAIPRYEFDTTLYGVESDLYQLLRLSHRTGSLRQKAFQITETQFNIDDDLIGLSLRDITDVYFERGYGYGEDGALSSHAVSGTSRSGWGWAGVGSSGTIGTGYTIGSTGTRVQLWDLAGNAPDIGTLGETAWITIGSEVLFVAGSVAASTYTIQRGTQSSDVGSHDAGEEGWIALPMNSDGDMRILWNGTEFTGTGPSGTVHEISTGTWGTVWRFW